MSARKVLVLGSGLVAKPCVDYLARDPSNYLTIACRTLQTAEKLAAGLDCCVAISLDVASTPDLEAQIAAHDIVISLVPFVYHADVIGAACKSKVNVVTTSYVSPAMKALEAGVLAAGIVVMNEVGVDPGIDHLYAIKFIEEVHAKGGKVSKQLRVHDVLTHSLCAFQVKEFYSYCGGIPAPEIADNPLGFKFSWSPRGALLSQCNSASFLKDGVQVHIPADSLMATAEPYYVMDGYSFVAYPNRNSVPFRDYYNIPEADTVIRGSLRYAGNPTFVKALADLGWLSQDQKPWLKDGLTWPQVMQQAIGSASTSESNLRARIRELCKFKDAADSDRIISGLQWLGLFTNEAATIRQGNLLDTLCAQLEKLLSYRPGERDLVMLQHKFVTESKEGKKVYCMSSLEGHLAQIT